MIYPTVQNLKDSVSGILTGTDLDNVTDLDGCIERAARTLVQKAYIPDSIGREEIVLYDGVFDYLVPDTIFGSTIVDLRPQGSSRSPWDFVYKKLGEQFDREKKFIRNGAEVALESDRGIPILRAVSSNTPARVILDAMTSITGWTASSNASTPVLDNTVYFDNGGSLRFNISASGTHGIISKTLTTGLDLTKYIGIGVVFVPIRIPSATAVTAVTVKVGSSSANYYSLSVTQGFLGAFRSGEWILLAFDLSLASTTGTPTITAMKYLSIDFTYGGTAVNNVYCGGMWISLPSPHTMLFSSAAIFQATGANATQSISADTDSIILSDSAYNIFQYECATNVAFNMGGKLAGAQIASINQVLHGVRARNGTVIQFGLYDLYRADNPNQNKEQTGNYYDD